MLTNVRILQKTCDFQPVPSGKNYFIFKKTLLQCTVQAINLTLNVHVKALSGIFLNIPILSKKI